MADSKNYHDHMNNISYVHGHVHENQKAVMNRLSRAIGHLEKVKRMVKTERTVQMFWFSLRLSDLR